MTQHFSRGLLYCFKRFKQWGVNAFRIVKSFKEAMNWFIKWISISVKILSDRGLKPATFDFKSYVEEHFFNYSYSFNQLNIKGNIHIKELTICIETCSAELRYCFWQQYSNVQMWFEKCYLKEATAGAWRRQRTLETQHHEVGNWRLFLYGPRQFAHSLARCFSDTLSVHGSILCNIRIYY